MKQTHLNTTPQFLPADILIGSKDTSVMSNDEIFHELATIAYAIENVPKTIISDLNRMEAHRVLTKYNDMFSHS